jgi:hypothetical protein
MSSEERLNRILQDWRSRHGREVMRYRGVKMLTVVDVSFEDGTTGRITRSDFGSWEIERSPDKKPIKTKPEDVSRTEALAAPNLKGSLKPAETPPAVE